MAKSIKKSLGERIREIKAVSKRKKRQKQMHADKKFKDLEEMKVMDRKMLRISIVKRLAKGKEKQGKRILKEKDLQRMPESAIVTLEKFSCPICLEIMVEPMLTPCGHAFCRPCIEESLLHKNSCSLCRESISFESPSESKFLRKMVEGILEPFLKSQQADEHEKRKKEYRQKVVKRAIGAEIKLGYKLDFYCEGKWLQGKIVASESIKDKTMLTITSQNGVHTRKLTPQSPLLAKLNSFTKPSSNSSFYSSFRSLHRSDFFSLFQEEDSSNSLFFFDFGMSSNNIFESIELVALPGFDELVFPPQSDPASSP